MPVNETLDWTPDGPRSRRFGDVYFSPEDGLAESRLVFLEGCGLPQAWRGRRRFVVGELGFGAGLNAAALIDLWRRERPPGGRLHLFSVEAFPMSAAEAGRALSAWPELSDVAAALLAAWPDGRRGPHRIHLPQFRVTIDLAIGEVAPALATWLGRADAWFLDGFAPSRNPQMWTPEVLALVAARSAPGARAATYTVAGAVRRGLEAAGFALERRPGHGRKRERLEARLPGAAVEASPPRTVAIVGGGIAGASLVRAFRALGLPPVLIEADGLGAGASGNPAALVTPRLDAGLGAVARLHAQAFARAVTLYDAEAADAVIARDVLQLEHGGKDAARFDSISVWHGFAPGALEHLDPHQTGAALGEVAGPGALRFRDGLTLEPARVLARWTAGASTLLAEVAALEYIGERWRLLDARGALVIEADVVCLATGLSAVTLAGLPPLRPVRGQASWTDAIPPTTAAAWGGYAIPTRTGMLFGASHDRGDLDRTPRSEDDRRNLERLAEGRPALAAQLSDAPVQSRAGIRAATPDHLPLAGAVPDAPGLFILAGLGGRGFTLAPLLAEHVAALAVGAPSPLPADCAALVFPGRNGARERAGL